MSSASMVFRWSRRSPAKLVAALRAHGPLRRVGRRDFERTYLDTFDGRLYAAGWTLTSVEEPAGRFLEGREPTGALRCRTAAPREPRFAGELPAGGLAEALTAVIAPRRLLRQATVVVRALRWDALDERDKTIARIFLERRLVGVPGEKGLRRWPARLVVEPLRGFEEAALDRVAACGDLGLEPATADELAEVLAVVGRRPGHDPARFDLTLDPEASAGEAAVAIERMLLGIARATEPGVRDDLDPEFLHDYRVALRRTRTLLGRLRGVFAAEPTAHFRRELGRLARETGPTRDLDVFLADLSAEAGAATTDLAADLVPLRDLLRRHRRRAQRRLVQSLESPRTARILNEWQAFLAAPEFGPAASQPARVVFGEALARARQRLLRDGDRLAAEASPEEFHRLRITAKRLRYVLEAAASLVDPGALPNRLAPLKALQELLGTAQDLAVREARLLDAARELGPAATPATLVAIGRWVERGHRLKTELYRSFPALFERFAREAEQKRWSRLLRPSR